jgi:putative ABC transport system permease protein
MIAIISYNFKIALEALFQNKLRSILTSLGIICGVASVIAMLAIGKGAQEEILEKMKLLGTNNIIIKQINLKEKEKNKDKSEDEQSKENVKKESEKYTPGLSLSDANNISKIIPGIIAVSPEIMFETTALRAGVKRDIYLIGTNNSFFDINQFKIQDGNYFNDEQIRNAIPVCIIGNAVKTKMFAGEEPIGKKIKCGNEWLTVIAVLEERIISKENIENLQIRDYNFDIYTPVTTMLIRFTNRSLITKKDLNPNRYEEQKEEQLNQLDNIVVQVEDSKNIKSIAEIINRMLLRRHNGVGDFEIVVPELLLEQEQNTRRIFNIVLGAIASISLIVGGIGIMNIMLASVLERTKEIGIRRAIGAKQNDILLQFLIEAVTISLSGGIIGIIIGVLFSYIIESTTDIKTIVSGLSVFISFIVSISVGLVFGITPARKASLQDPIDLLRYE